MDISKVFQSPIISEGIRRRYVLSFRRYNKLSKKEKEIFDKYKDQYTPNEWRLALQIKVSLRKPFKKRYFKLAHKIKPLEVEKYYLTHGYPGHSIEVNFSELALANEFKFQGFIPLMEFKRYKSGFAYIISNKKLAGTYWIYPKKLADGLINIIYKNRYKELWSTFSSLGITGCTYARQSGSHIIFNDIEKQLKSLEQVNNSRRH